MTGPEKIINIAKQLDAMKTSGGRFLICPYCEKTVVEGQEFCCPNLVHAVTAVMDAGELHNLIEHAERISERMSVN